MAPRPSDLPRSSTARVKHAARAWEVVRRQGPRAAIQVAGERLWSERIFFGLRCRLDDLPEVRRAKLPLRMTPADDAPHVFDAEERQTRDFDLEQVLMRQAWLAAGVRQLHVAWHEGSPAYCQWLVRPADQEALHAHEPGAHPWLADDEVLLEGAYTFLDFRRMGAMADGMSQLLGIARAEGFSSALTYVEDTNVPSLRGCQAVGFEIDHCRIGRRRLGRHTTLERPAHAADRGRWTAAVAPAAA